MRARTQPNLRASIFFSSRRRHTRCLSDWSSDVCSSDLERAYKIAPFRTGVRMLGEIEAQALPEMIFPEDKGELVENPGSFGINDRAVGGFRVFEIGDVLIDGCCALGRIDPINGRFDEEI